MRIVCPACEAVYEVPGSLLDTPRAVRCARCGQEWLPEAASPAEPPPDPRLSSPPGPPPSLAERAAGQAAGAPDSEPRLSRAAEPRLPAPPVPRPRVPVAPPPPSDPMLTVFPPLVGRPERRGARAAGLAWAVSLLLLVLILIAAYVWRSQVQAAWPPIQRAYAAIGLR